MANNKKKRIQSKKKGNRVELEFSKILNERFNLEKGFIRVPYSGAFSTNNRIYKDTREDALNVLSGDLICPEGFRFSIEIKSRAEFNFWDLLNEDNDHTEILNWIAQSENDSICVNKQPLLLIKINNKKPFAMFPSTLYKANMEWNGYSIVRFDYFMKFDDSFFWEKEKKDEIR